MSILKGAPQFVAEQPEIFKGFEQTELQKAISALSYYESLPLDEQETLELEYPGVFEWLSGKPIPQPQVKKNWWDTGPVGWLKDKGANIMGSFLEALTVPADAVEVAIGYPMSYIYSNDLPDGVSRMDMAKLNFDITLSYFTGGIEEPANKMALINMEAAKGTPWEEIKSRVEEPWLDTAAKIISDPLWLIGGVGPLAKVPGVIGRKIPVLSRLLPAAKGGEKAWLAARASAAATRGAHNLERLSKFTNFTPSWIAKTQPVSKEVAAAYETAAKLAKASEGMQLGPIGKIIEFGVIGGGEAPVNLYNLSARVSKYPILGKPLRIAGALLGPKPHDMAQFDIANQILKASGARAQALRTGNSRVPLMGVFNRLFRVRPAAHFINTVQEFDNLFTQLLKDVDGLSQAEMGMFIDAFSAGKEGINTLPGSLRRKLPNEYLMSPLGDELGTIYGGTGLMMENLPSLRKTFDTPEAFRLAFHDDMRRLFVPALAKDFGIPIVKGAKGVARVSKTSGEKALGLYKTALSMTTLNTPSFVVLNAMNNVATLFWDYGVDIFRAKGGFFRNSVENHFKAIGEDAGIIANYIQAGSIRHMLGLESKAFQSGWRRWASAFVGISSDIDAWARMKAWQVGRQRGLASMSRWIEFPTHFHLYGDGGQGILKGTVDALADGDGEAVITRFKEDIANGYHPNIGHTLKDDYARSLWPDLDDAQRALRSAELGPVAAELDEMYRLANGDVDRFMAQAEDLKHGLLSDTDAKRLNGNLEPLGTIEGVTDTPATLNAAWADWERRRGQATKQMFSDFLLGGDMPKHQVTDALLRLDEAYRVAAADREYVFKMAKAAKYSEDEAADAIAKGLLSGEEIAKAKDWGAPRLWEHYLESRKVLFATAYEDLLKKVNNFDPHLARPLRTAAEMHMNLYKNEDVMRHMAFMRNEEWRYGDNLSPLRREFNDMANDDIRRLEKLLGLPPKYDYAYPAADSIPSVAEAVSKTNVESLQFLDWAIPRIVEEMHVPTVIPTEFVDEALEWADSLVGTYRSMSATANRVGERMAEWTMLNYDAYGTLDTWLMWVMPYHFWPVRSMYRWTQRTMANPGLMAILAKTEELKRDINEGLPDRIASNWRMPLPFLGGVGEAMFGTSGTFFFDPMEFMFPTLQWADDFSLDSRTNTMSGRILDWFGNNGPGLSPLVPLVGTATGLLDKNEWLSRNWPRTLPFGIPGTPAMMGVMAWLEGDDRINIDSLISEEEQKSLLKGTGLPLAAAQRLIDMEDDEWDGYRIDRALSDLIAEKVKDVSDPEERREIIRDYIEAALDPDHPLWKEARNFASKEAGIRSLTSWMFMPIGYFPDGEMKQLSLKEVYSEYAAADKLEEFYERYPEYRLRQIAIRNFDSKEERDNEAKRALFFMDIDEATRTLEQSEAEFDAMMKVLESDPEFWVSKEGRFFRSLIEEEYADRVRLDQERINQLYAFAGDSLEIPSYSRTPVERAAAMLSDEYYAIQIQDFLPKGKTMETATDDEIWEAMDRWEDARNEWLAKFPTEKVSPEMWRKKSAEYFAAGLWADKEAARLAKEKEWDKRDAVLARANEVRDEITQWAIGSMSRSQLENWLSRNQEPPSEPQAMYDEARAQMDTYMAMGEDGLGWPKEVRQQYWDSHPLLELFYGNSPSPWEVEMPVWFWEAYARLDEIRTSYYNKPGERRLPYLSMVLDELNGLLNTLGLPTVEIGRNRLGRWDLRIPGIGLPTEDDIRMRLGMEALSEALIKQ